MTDTAPLRTAEAQKVQRQLDKKRSEYERLQKLLMSLYESLADGIIDRDEYALKCILRLTTLTYWRIVQ